MADEKIVWDAEFNPAVMTYWLLGGTIVLTVTVIGIPLLPIWLGVGMFVTRRYLDSHRCLLTDRNLKVTKGIFVQTEKTVPLDRVTDLGLVQGPIMRALGIEGAFGGDRRPVVSRVPDSADRNPRRPSLPRCRVGAT